MTARTTKEAFGIHLSKAAFERQPVLTAGRAISGLLLVGVLIAISRQQAARDDIQTLIANGCRPFQPTVDGQHIWRCIDGFRVNDIAGDGL